MNKWLVVFLTVLIGVLGFGLGRWTSSETPSTVSRTPRSSAPENYTLVSEPPAFSESEAQDHRSSHYTELKSIDDVLDLPGDFAQTEALYAIAGRAGRLELEKLIQQSIDIVNRHDRLAALGILFGRYGEIDPGAAVDYLVAINLDIDAQMFSTIFDAWAKVDVGAAIEKANQLTNLRQRERAGVAILTSIARSNERLLDQVAADLDGNFKLEQFRSESIASRASSDPVRALQEALAMESMNGRWSAVSRVARVWARSDPASAMEVLDQIKDKNMRDAFLSQILQRWVADDSVQAMQYINAYPDQTQRREMLQKSLRIYAKENPQEAMAAALQLNGEYKRLTVIGVLSQWAEDDPGTAMASLAAIENRALRQQTMDIVGRHMATQSTDKAIEWLDSFDVETRKSQLSGVLAQVAQSDPRRALEYVLANTTDANRDSTLLSILRVTSMTDPIATQDYLGQLTPGAQTNRIYQELAGQMASTDSAAALQWVATLAGDQKSNALKGLAYGLSQTEPEQASSLIHQMSGEDAAELIQNISRGLSYRDPESAISWLQQFRGHASYESAMSNVAVSVANTDPRRALDMASRLGNKASAEVTSVALSRWAATDPGAAANWAAGANRSVRSQAVNSVAVQWARSDPTRASGWVSSLPSGDGKNQALMSLARVIPANVNELANVVSSISSDDMRRQSIRQTWSRLRNEQDERAANAFLDKVGADQDLIDRLLSGGG